VLKLTLRYKVVWQDEFSDKICHPVEGKLWLGSKFVATPLHHSNAQAIL